MSNVAEIAPVLCWKIAATSKPVYKIVTIVY